MGRTPLFLAVLATACSGPEAGQLEVWVDTDLAVPDRLDQVRIEVTNDRGETSTAMLANVQTSDLPLRLTLVPARPQSSVIIDAIGMLAGSEIVRQEVRTSFPASGLHVVSLWLLDGCVGRDCGADQTCRAQGCTDAVVSVADLSLWSESFRARGDAGMPSGSDGGIDCGNGTIDEGEHCDDGNRVAHDGCENDCRYTCESDTTQSHDWFQDCDRDGFAALLPAQPQCLMPPPPSCDTLTGQWILLAPTSGAIDCVDTDPAIHPGAPERCNGMDDDCDGSVDDGLTGFLYRDNDGDGHGDPDPAGMVTGCATHTGYVGNNDDCNDDCASCYPGNVEICDCLDNDCDAIADNGVLTQFFHDGDGDGYGDPSMPISACLGSAICGPPAGSSSNNGDCCDGDGAAHPGQMTPSMVQRVGCGGFDFNCNGDIEIEHGVRGGTACACTPLPHTPGCAPSSLPTFCLRPDGGLPVCGAQAIEISACNAGAPCGAATIFADVYCL